MSSLPEKYDIKLTMWCIDCYTLLTQNYEQSSGPVSSSCGTKTHPYQSSEDYSGTVTIPRAIRLTCSFDPQTKSENNYDFLKIWTDSTKEKQIRGPSDEGKFTGRTIDTWPSFEVI